METCASKRDARLGRQAGGDGKGRRRAAMVAFVLGMPAFLGLALGGAGVLAKMHGAVVAAQMGLGRSQGLAQKRGNKE